MRRLLQIRGTNGSGKTTMVRNLLGEGFDNSEAIRVREGYAITISKGVREVAGRRWIAIGDYQKLNAGLDTIRTTEDAQRVIQIVWESFPAYSLVFEGVLASTVWSTWAEFVSQIAPSDNRCAFMATDFQTCVERVLYRRTSSGKEARHPANSAQKFRQILNIQPKYESAGLKSGWVLDLSHVEDLLK